MTGQVNECASPRDHREHERPIVPSLRRIHRHIQHWWRKEGIRKIEVPFLGAIPFDPEVRVLGDSEFFLDRATRAEGSFKKIVDLLLERIHEVEKLQLGRYRNLWIEG